MKSLSNFKANLGRAILNYLGHSCRYIRTPARYKRSLKTLGNGDRVALARLHSDADYIKHFKDNSIYYTQKT